MDLDTIIRRVQENLGVTNDGRPGPATWDAIYRHFFPNSLAAQVAERPALVVTGGEVDPRSEGVIATLLPEVQPYARELLTQCAASGIIIKVISGLRTYAEQDALFAKRPQVTKVRGGYSNHNFGLAFDIGVFQGGEYVPESPVYKAVGAIGMRLGLGWGGNWRSIQDEPHFELRPAWASDLSESQMLAGLRQRKADGKGLMACLAIGAFSLAMAATAGAAQPLLAPVLLANAKELLDAQAIYVFGGILGLLGIYVLILNAIAAHKKVFGRTPPIEVELNGKADAKDMTRMQIDLQGFTQTKEFDAHREEMRLRTLGLQKEISDARHDFNDQINRLVNSSASRDESTTEDLGELRRQLNETDKLLSALDERSRNVQGTISNFDRKLDRLIAARPAQQA